jgi:hypothetical protein
MSTSMFGAIGKFLSAAAVLASSALLTVSSGGAEDASGCQNPPAKKVLDTRWPINIELLSDQLVVYRCTDYVKDVAGALVDARTWVQQRAPQVEKAAVVFDIDETSLSNWEVLHHNQFAYFGDGACDLSVTAPCGEREWDLSARAVALQPTLEFFRLIKTLSDKNGDRIAIFFVTGRYEDPSERVATQWNLRKEGYDSWERLYMRPKSTSNDLVSKYKTDSRKDIEKQHTIIANVGDQYSDLIGDPDNDHAEKCFKIPNPFYFIGPPLPDAGLKCLSR